LLAPRPRTAIVLAMLWGAALIAFSLAGVYWLAVGFLFLAGFLELSFNAMAQSLVQLNAPLDQRGRVIGLFNMASLGLRAFSGVSVGLIGSVIGIHWSLALAALAAMTVAGGLLFLPQRTAEHRARPTSH
jgi:MFS family permease